MFTTINLTFFQMQELMRLIEQHVKKKHTKNCKIEFLENGNLRVWANRIGYLSKDLKDMR